MILVPNLKKNNLKIDLFSILLKRIKAIVTIVLSKIIKIHITKKKNKLKPFSLKHAVTKLKWEPIEDELSIFRLHKIRKLNRKVYKHLSCTKNKEVIFITCA